MFEIVFYGLLAILVLGAIALVIYEFRKAGSDISEGVSGLANRILGPDKVVTPPKLQAFMDEPSNQPGGYTPWTPEDDD
jgi:hypothetical protein